MKYKVVVSISFVWFIYCFNLKNSSCPGYKTLQSLLACLQFWRCRGKEKPAGLGREWRLSRLRALQATYLDHPAGLSLANKVSLSHWISPNHSCYRYLRCMLSLSSIHHWFVHKDGILWAKCLTVTRLWSVHSWHLAIKFEIDPPTF